MFTSMLSCMDIVGTVAFALSGAMVGLRKNMDIFGVMVLAIVTAVGGGITRDILIGNLPPISLRNPFNITLSIVVACVLFGFFYFRKEAFSDFAVDVYQRCLFWSDTFGLAAFTVAGTLMGIQLPGIESSFLPVCLGTLTGAGGGVIRDVLSNRTPEIFLAEIYAVACIIGALVLYHLMFILPGTYAEMCSFFTVVIVRCVAVRKNLSLPKAGRK